VRDWRFSVLAGRGGGARGDLRAPGGVGSQDTVKAQQVRARGGDQDGEFLDELQGIEQEVGGAIPSGMGKLVQQLAGGRFRQPVERQG
jgi:hypothetical protein